MITTIAFRSIAIMTAATAMIATTTATIEDMTETGIETAIEITATTATTATTAATMAIIGVATTTVMTTTETTAIATMASTAITRMAPTVIPTDAGASTKEDMAMAATLHS